MTTLDTAATTDRTMPDGTVPEGPSHALRARRWFLVAAPVLAGGLAVVGAAADPAAGIADAELYRLYAENPGPLQVKSLALHWSYAFWIAPALLIAPYVRGRGAWLATVTAFVGFVGMTTLPGLLFTDWYDSAIGQVYGVEGNLAVTEQMNQMWGVPVFTTPGVVGLMLALPLTALTLWRAGLARWWALLPVLAGLAAFTLSNVLWWGCVITTLCFAVFSWVLARATAPVPQSRHQAASPL
jgi:hypothetical protein